METTGSRPRIDRVWSRNFRSVRTLDLELGDLTVLVGRNGAGKSNVVDVLRFLRDCVARGFEQALLNRGGLPTVTHRGEADVEVGIEVRHQDWRCRYDTRWQSEDGSRSERLRVRLVGDDDWTTIDTADPATREVIVVFDSDLRGDATLLSERGTYSVMKLARSPASRDLDHLGPWMSRVQTPDQAGAVVRDVSLYDFAPRLLRDPQRVVNPSPLNEEGANLVAVLRRVLDGPDGDTVRRALRQLVDGATDLEVQSVGAHLVAEVLYDAGGDGTAEPSRFDLGLESDGTVRLIAILAALYQSPPPPLVVIEEPERNIHPGALGILADVIREASTRMQIVITTHSPDLIDRFDPEDIRVVERVAGATVVGKMEAAQRDIVREKLFTTGELMRVQGLIRETE